MFEAVHGSAPDIAGQDIANPSGLLVAATQLLVHVGQAQVAERIKNAWLKTLEDGVHTGDIFQEGLSSRRVGTKAFTEAVIERLGQAPKTLEPVKYNASALEVVLQERERPKKELVGVDVFLDWDELGRSPEVLGARLQRVADDVMRLKMITNRGVKVFPGGFPETFCTDHWRCRFMGEGVCSFDDVLALLGALHKDDLDVIKTEHLYLFDGVNGYSKGQGE